MKLRIGVFCAGLLCCLSAPLEADSPASGGGAGLGFPAELASVTRISPLPPFPLRSIRGGPLPEPPPRRQEKLEDALEEALGEDEESKKSPRRRGKRFLIELEPELGWAAFDSDLDVDSAGLFGVRLRGSWGEEGPFVALSLARVLTDADERVRTATGSLGDPVFRQEEGDGRVSLDELQLGWDFSSRRFQPGFKLFLRGGWATFDFEEDDDSGPLAGAGLELYWVLASAKERTRWRVGLDLGARMVRTDFNQLSDEWSSIADATAFLAFRF